MSSSRDAAVGMMDAAYFTGRKELLEFFNDLLDLNLTKIEQTASGAVACQLTEYIFPGSIPMSRVNWEAKSDYEYVQNYKLLQVAFTKNRIQRHVDVDKLIRGKYQDNLEFCQWLKAFFDQTGAYREDYDPLAVRARGKGGKKMVAAAGKKRGKTTTTRPTKTTNPAAAPRNKATPTVNNKKTLTSNKQKENSSSGNGTGLTDAVLADAQLMKKNADLNNQISELNTKMSDMELDRAEVEKERDFYFEKLRSVEILLQVHQEQEGADPNEMIDRVFKVLYATMEDSVVVDDNGEFVNSFDVATGESDLGNGGSLD